MTDTNIRSPAVEAAPLQYILSGAQEVVLKSVTASFDGTGAGGSYVPCLQILDPSGNVAGTFPLGSTIAAGASVDVSWFPGVKAPAAAAGSGWQFDTDPQSGDWGVVSTTSVDPTTFTSTGFTGTLAFRVDDTAFTSQAHGILLYSAEGSLASGHWSYFHAHGRRATIEAQAIVEIQAFSQNPCTIGSVLLNFPNLPTSNAGLAAGDVYRNGAGANVALMIV